MVNVSEGRDEAVIADVASAAGSHLIDLHRDAGHHRSVLTLAGPGVEDSVREVARRAVARIDLGSHRGVHPRMGALDVVPFVPLSGSTLDEALAARDRFARWAGQTLGLPCFRYGPERSLPEVRRGAFTAMAPDAGPPRPHPTAGAAAVGARHALVAYNLWLEPGASAELAREVARSIRSPAIRALGLDVEGRAQVSCNLVQPSAVGPDAAFDAVASHAAIEEAELVGLIPAPVLDAIPRWRWAELDLDPSRTIEARLGSARLGSRR